MLLRFYLFRKVNLKAKASNGVKYFPEFNLDSSHSKKAPSVCREKANNYFHQTQLL